MWIQNWYRNTVFFKTCQTKLWFESLTFLPAQTCRYVRHESKQNHRRLSFDDTLLAFIHYLDDWYKRSEARTTRIQSTSVAGFWPDYRNPPWFMANWCHHLIVTDHPQWLGDISEWQTVSPGASETCPTDQSHVSTHSIIRLADTAIKPIVLRGICVALNGICLALSEIL